MEVNVYMVNGVFSCERYLTQMSSGIQGAVLTRGVTKQASKVLIKFGPAPYPRKHVVASGIMIYYIG